jgi:hypothetical protein
MTSKPPAPNPAMVDSADKSVHRGRKTKPNPSDDLEDPAESDPQAPHDRGMARDQNFEGAREDMIEQIGEGKDAWRKGRTQNK